MIKINPEKYCEIFKDWPNHDMVLSGWEFNIKYYLFGLIPVIIYTKKLIK
jgi:hypothetical protein